MKRILTAILVIFMALILSACGNDTTDGNNSADVTPTPVPTVAPAPVATATPVPILNADSYVMQWKNDAGRGINYMVPTHWKISASGERYVVFSEPVPDGESCFRVCFANKKKGTQVDADRMRKEFRTLMSEMETMYADFKWDGEILRDTYLVRFKGYSANYTYTDDNGEPMQGYAIMATYDRRIYCMTYSGPVSRYIEMKGIFTKMLDNMTRIS